MPYGNNMNICAAEVPVHKKPVLSSSLATTLLQSLLILDASTVPSEHGTFFSQALRMMANIQPHSFVPGQ